MVTYQVQFVDQVSSTPAVRLDLNTAPWTTREGTEFGLPELRRAVVSSVLVDGDRYPAAAYGNRTLSLLLRVDAGDDDAEATQLQRLYRELDRKDNVLLFRPGTSAPVYFRTFRCGPDRVQWDPFTKEVRAQVPAEPFAVGLKETLSQVTVPNDPSEGTTLNANPYFETNASDWSAVGGSVVRSTAQAHQGSASLLLTPDGVTASVEARATAVSASVGQQLRSQAWVRCAVARSVAVGVIWRDGANAPLTTSTSTVPVAANTWTLIDTSATAPASTAFAQLVVGMGSTPPGSNTLYIDEARLFEPGTGPAMFFDIAGGSIRGDVETPLFLSVLAADVVVTGRRQSAIAVRRRGTPSAMPLVLQAEAMSVDVDTSVQTDSAMSGSGANFARTTFAAPAMNRRLYLVNAFPATPSVDARGTYRVFARVRKSVSGDVITMRLTASYNGAAFNGDTVTLPSGIEPRWVDLGLLPYPVGYDPVTDGYSGSTLAVTGSALSVWAARSSGSGNLDTDALLFVPADDRYCQVQWAQWTGPTSLVLDSSANAAYGVGASGELAPTELMELAGLPPMVTPGQAARVVFVQDVGSTSSGGDSRTGSTRITPYYWPRYLHVRPVAS
ncbi:hypothetical protein [Micromonospora tarensis]|uniref:Carbohydrate binding domain-containing protein n=1 Tax=Micromonospora tarensis TaxID=2806100 RepID=A0ABS1YK58_9ACTN|nr:hypothetical protein [Micromonospora tarensis]MBM0277805.1 hypothetical protein [Micromonospora tarensis]